MDDVKPNVNNIKLESLNNPSYKEEFKDEKVKVKEEIKTENVAQTPTTRRPLFKKSSESKGNRNKQSDTENADPNVLNQSDTKSVRTRFCRKSSDTDVIENQKSDPDKTDSVEGKTVLERRPSLRKTTPSKRETETRNRTSRAFSKLKDRSVEESSQSGKDKSTSDTSLNRSSFEEPTGSDSDFTGTYSRINQPCLLEPFVCFLTVCHGCLSVALCTIVQSTKCFSLRSHKVCQLKYKVALSGFFFV